MPAGPTPFDPRHLISIDQLSADDIFALLAKAETFSKGAFVEARRFSAAVLMLQPSLRTRLGFAEAVTRLGGVAHVISTRRELVDGSADESLPDTLRVANGMTDVTIVRADGPIADSVRLCRRPVINAGDDEEHPTQALIDLFAIQQVRGPWQKLSIGVCGDLRMRAARSLCKALAIVPPRRIRLMAPASRRGDAEALLAPIRDRVEWAEGGDWTGLDALYLGGLPERRGADVIEAPERALYSVSSQNIARLSEDARVFSPMPVIDEIADALRPDPRIAMYVQSDLSVAMRMAVLAHVLAFDE